VRSAALLAQFASQGRVDIYPLPYLQPYITLTLIIPTLTGAGLGGDDCWAESDSAALMLPTLNSLAAFEIRPEALPLSLADNHGAWVPRDVAGNICLFDGPEFYGFSSVRLEAILTLTLNCNPDPDPDPNHNPSLTLTLTPTLTLTLTLTLTPIGGSNPPQPRWQSIL